MSAKQNRRQFHCQVAATVSALSLPVDAACGEKEVDEPFALNYMLASCMYGYGKLAEIMPEVAKGGATAIDVWPKVHGNQREQIDEIGEEAFASMLKQHGVGLGCITQYKLGPFALSNEMKLARRLGCGTIVTGGRGPKGQRGSELKSSVKRFVEQLKPHLAEADEHRITIAIENHSNNLISSTDSMHWLMEFSQGERLGIALAPYHLEQDADKLGKLIRSLGNRVKVFYAWQHGNGCMQKQPKQDELLQLPGKGSLDFEPLLAALKAAKYSGWTEVFMHPFPRGIPIHSSTARVTAEINSARRYLDGLI